MFLLKLLKSAKGEGAGISHLASGSFLLPNNLTRTSILCLTHQKSGKKRNYPVIPVGTLWYCVSLWRYWLVLGSAAWYLVVQGQYRAFMPVSIGKWRFGRVLPMCYSLTGRQTTKYSTTQLV